MKQDIDTALARLTEAFPQTFVLEKYRKRLAATLLKLA